MIEIIDNESSRRLWQEILLFITKSPIAISEQDANR